MVLDNLIKDIMNIAMGYLSIPHPRLILNILYNILKDNCRRGRENYPITKTNKGY